MKYFAVIFSLVLFTSCAQPQPSNALSHMRKSYAIDTIVQNMDQLNYDESYSELDRDQLMLSYAQDFYNEVHSLTLSLKSNPTLLPNKQVITPEKQKDYATIIQLLDASLIHLQHVIATKEVRFILPAITSTKQSCTQCHKTFKVTKCAL